MMKDQLFTVYPQGGGLLVGAVAFIWFEEFQEILALVDALVKMVVSWLD